MAKKRPSVDEAGVAACELSARRWGQDPREMCGAEDDDVARPARTLAQRKWWSSSIIPVQISLFGEDVSFRRMANPAGLMSIGKDAVPNGVPRSHVVGAYQTKGGNEVYTWRAHEDAFHAVVVSQDDDEILWLECSLYPGSLEPYESEIAALGAALRVEAELADSSWTPDEYHDVEDALAGFARKPRTRVEFHRLFLYALPGNDNAGALTASPEELAEAFDTAFHGTRYRAANVIERTLDNARAVVRRLLR